MIKEKIILNFPELKFIFLEDKFDSCIIGIDSKRSLVIYSVLSILNILEEDMEIEDAKEYYEKNILNVYNSQNDPILVDDEILLKEFNL